MIKKFLHYLPVVLLAFLQSVTSIENSLFFIEDGWYNQTHAGYVGHFKIPIKVEFVSWWIALVFSNSIDSFNVWQGTFMKHNQERTVFYFKSQQWNDHNYPGSVLDQRYLVEFRRYADIDYRLYKGQRPWIVFRHKVYQPHPTEDGEFPMQEYDKNKFKLPWDLDNLPVPDAITRAATTTLAPLTKGPDSGPFWWVRTRYAKPTRSTTTERTSSTQITTTVTTTPVEIKTLTCVESKQSRKSRCANPDVTRCYIPQCYSTNQHLFVIVQCWKFSQKICWCVDEISGRRTSDPLPHKSRGSLPCLTKTDTTIVAPTTTPLVQNAMQIQQPPFAPRMDYQYDLVIDYSLRFFAAQRSGTLVDGTNRIRWRRSAHESDGRMCRRDLSGGYYVSGDYIKYSFPTASAMTMLAWGFIEFREAYEEAGQVEELKDALKWSSDYFMKCHVSKYTFYGQVGSSAIENSYWERPEDMMVDRPCYAVGASNPGSDLAAEVAASLASTALVWLKTDSDKTYVKKLLDHARDLFDFAMKYRQTYSVSIRVAEEHYESSGYEDELVWAALWLYMATGEQYYLGVAGKMFDQYKFDGVQYDVSWDNKIVPLQLIMHQLAPEAPASSYLQYVKKFCQFNLPGGGARYTPEGLLFISGWGTTGFAGNAALTCLIASKSKYLDDTSKKEYRKFAESQLEYLLGKTGKSYMIGYGREFPRKPHHRSSSCSRSGRCGWDEGYKNAGNNPNMLIGAIVGGPDINDQWVDDRANYTSNGVSLGYNAGFQGAAAGLLHFQLQYKKWREWKENND